MSNSEDEDVGYKRPPKHSQFKKGQTGNPKGRPKNARNFKTDLKEELSQLIVVRENGRERKISKMRALLKVIVNAAVLGDLRAAQTIVTFSTKYLGGEETPVPTADTAEDQDIIDAFVDRELTRRRAGKAPRSAKTNNKDKNDKA
jgi:hypothetical protein